MTEDQLGMVSEWIPNGNIMEFVRANPNADRLGLVRFPPGTPISLLADDRVAAAAERRRKGVDVHA